MMEKRKGLTPDLTGKGIQERKNILKTAKFISEDLTPFRNKIFRYVKKWNDENHKWDVVATNYGKICCKIKNVDKKWISITTTDDFFDAGIPFDDEFKNEFQGDVVIL